MHILRLLLLAVLFISTLWGQTDKKSVGAVRVDTPPSIDGEYDASIWDQASAATGFFNFEPQSGGAAPFKTEMRFLYDDVNLYVFARMHDPDPGSIKTQLGKRDDNDVVADWIGIWFNPFNDGANELVFQLTAAGVQIDMKWGTRDRDSNWNPVWESATYIDELGWTAEMAIPFSQIRFPAKDLQTWGVNMARYKAENREVYTWTLLDKVKDNFAQQAGLLTGIKNIETPLRLSFTPYASASMDRYPLDEGGTGSSMTYRGGMDLKYGINESFTLDMTLIPDFGQVQSDNVELNLSPFEIRYDEHRPFFTEGTDLLQKANLFYSRRVGSKPIRYWDIEDLLEDGESIKENPDVTQLINASKVTGQTNTGLGLGFFNAMTAPMHAVIEDSLGRDREVLTNPLSNYNLMVVSKNLQNGSEVSVVNTNVQRFAEDDTSNDFRDANVTGYDVRLYSPSAKWRFETGGAYSQLMYTDSSSTGYRYFLELIEDQGAFQYGFGHHVESEFFNPNDLGFLRQPNEVVNFAWIEMRTLDPVWKVNHANISFRVFHESLFEPNVYSSLGFRSNYEVTFKNYISMGGGTSLNPRESHDYYETRTEGRYFTVPKTFDTHLWLASNYNKPFSASGWMGISSKTRRGSQWRGGGFNPKWRVNNQFMIQYELDLHHRLSNHGFADFDENDDPVFGRRDHITATNAIYSQYIVSRNLESEFRMRYYRSTVDYMDFFDLKDDGNLRPRTYNEDLNTVFNAFTIDAGITWRFAPGSEVSLNWKNAIYTDGEDPSVTWMEDFSDLPNQDQSNSISIKLLYYVDSWALRHKL